MKIVAFARKNDGIVYKPLPKQQHLHYSKKRFKGYVGGIGSGKSLWLVADAFKYAIQYPGTIQIITAPSYRMLRDATLLTFNEWVPEEALMRWDAKRNTWLFWNGSEVWFRSTDDPDSLRGPNINRFLMDEGSKDKHASWKILIGRIRRVTMDPYNRLVPNGGVVVGTPKGYNWLYDVFVKKASEDHELVRTASTENKYLPEDFLSSLEHEYSGEFYRQEVLGEFTSHEGLVYKSFSRDTHVTTVAEAAKRHKYFIGGIDWGYANPMVCLLISVDGDENLTIIDEIYQRRMTLDEFREKISVMERKAAEDMGLQYPFNVTYWCDPADTSIGTGGMMSRLRDTGMDIRKANNEILPGINAVQKRFEAQTGKPRLVITPQCIEVANELEQYSYDEYDPEKPQKDKPLKLNDHAMDALRYAVMSLEQQDRIASLRPGAFFR